MNDFMEVNDFDRFDEDILRDYYNAKIDLKFSKRLTGISVTGFLTNLVAGGASLAISKDFPTMPGVLMYGAFTGMWGFLLKKNLASVKRHSDDVKRLSKRIPIEIDGKIR